MSPASGDFNLNGEFIDSYSKSFHSINVPSEWGPRGGSGGSCEKTRFHSINVPSEWGPKAEAKALDEFEASSFHSINVPSEWGQSG